MATKLVSNKYPSSVEMQIESRFIVTTKLSVEGPLRMKEEYIEGIFESPKVNEESIPEQLRGALSQAASTIQQLPVSIRDAMAGGLKVPLGQHLILIFRCHFSRMNHVLSFIISLVVLLISSYLSIIKNFRNHTSIIICDDASVQH